MKSYEKASCYFIPQGHPLIVRLDGKAFHTFTKFFEKPYDKVLNDLMKSTALFMVNLHKANLAYVQSDEISLCWYTNIPERQQIFGGKRQKIESILASQCSVYFNRELMKVRPDLVDWMPVFDCRAFDVHTVSEATNYFVWRQNDAVRNSINSAGFNHFSKTELYKKTQADIYQMLKDSGVTWEDYPEHYKYGTFYMQFETLEEIPKKFYQETDIGVLKNNPDKIKTLFGKYL